MDTLLAAVVTVACCCVLFEAMSSLKNFRMVACTIIAVLCFNYLTVAQYCDNSSTAINGKIFPPLIDATVEDLVAGLETGLFTSVDLVNVRGANQICISY